MAKTRAQGIRNVVEILKKKKVFQADAMSKDYRPWGWFDQIASGHEFQVKRMLFIQEHLLVAKP